uniref:Nucleolar and spindle associated protein 1 n=1 Tax=Pundamilia nyererei TaxID=303518 RepID=A0A3B4H2H1_9CICH
MDLDSMKYAELRSLAKELGLKANMKEKSEVVLDSSCKEEVSSTTGFVNTRRGKGKGNKRKISDTATLTKSDAKIKNYPPPPPKKKCINKSLNMLYILFVYPDFKKLHEAHFNKMESIDSYVQRKTKQMETYRNSVKELKSLSDKTKLLQVDGKAQRANPTRASMFSPAPVNKTPGGENRRHTVLSATKKPLSKEVTSFRPSVLSTRRINVRFSEATHDNEYKRSLVKTPARMSPCVASSTPQKQTANGLKPSSVKTASFSATKTPGPFVFTGNTSTSTTPGTNKKPSFDLKASLSRPLTYKPHKGKLKPFEDVKENTAMNKSVSNPHQEAYKQHKVQSRQSRRAKQIQDRKQKKESMLGARRGLVMA